MLRHVFLILMPYFSSPRVLEEKNGELSRNRNGSFIKIQLAQTSIFHETMNGRVPYEILKDYGFVFG